jgi:putative holliday junction resolvase
MHNPINPRSTIFGFDFGLRRIGVAVGQLLTATATPLTIINANQGEPDWNALDRLVEEWKPSVLVVGLPWNMDGASQKITLQAQEFAKKLEVHYKLPVYTTDERLTTKEAREQIFSEGGYKALQKRVDSTAAQIILTGWLQSQNK